MPNLPTNNGTNLDAACRPLVVKRVIPGVLAEVRPCPRLGDRWLTGWLLMPARPRRAAWICSGRTRTPDFRSQARVRGPPGTWACLSSVPPRGRFPLIPRPGNMIEPTDQWSLPLPARDRREAHAGRDAGGRQDVARAEEVAPTTPLGQSCDARRPIVRETPVETCGLGGSSARGRGSARAGTPVVGGIPSRNSRHRRVDDPRSLRAEVGTPLLERISLSKLAASAGSTTRGRLVARALTHGVEYLPSSVRVWPQGSVCLIFMNPRVVRGDAYVGDESWQGKARRHDFVRRRAPSNSFRASGVYRSSHWPPCGTRRVRVRRAGIFVRLESAPGSAVSTDRGPASAGGLVLSRPRRRGAAAPDPGVPRMPVTKTEAVVQGQPLARSRRNLHRSRGPGSRDMAG